MNESKLDKMYHSRKEFFMANTTKSSDSAGSGENQEVKTQNAVDDKKTTVQENKNASDNDLNLSDEQWKQVYESPRFKTLNEDAKTAKAKLAEYETQAEKDRQKKLKEEGKVQELLEESTKKNESLTSENADLRLKIDIMSIASRLKVVDTEAITKLIDKSKLQADKDGKYINTEEVVQQLLEDKPYLVGEGSDKSSNIGTNSNTTTENQSGSVLYTKSEIRQKSKNHEWYLENKDKIELAQKEGRIDYSR